MSDLRLYHIDAVDQLDQTKKALYVLPTVIAGTVIERAVKRDQDTPVALRQKQVDCAGAPARLKDEGLLEHLPFGPGAKQ
jgi:hypothetical protein